MNTTNLKKHLLTAATLAIMTLAAQAQWNKNSSAGPYNYTDTANWNGGVINNQFLTNVTTGLTINFPANYAFTSQVLLAWSNNAAVTFQSSSATPQTLTFAANGGFVVSNSLGGTITIGTTNNPLILDLAGATNCTLGGVAGSSGTANTAMNIYAQIIDSVGGSNTLNLSGDRVVTVLWNTNNSFVGPVNFYALRGGGFANLKPIGSGPSALGAPTSAATGTISATDSGSQGYMKYAGAGDICDRNFIWNVTFSNAVANAFQLANCGTGLLQLTGQMSFPTNSTKNAQFLIYASNAPIELDGYIHGAGNANGTSTFISFAGGPNGTATNRITLLGLTNDFRDFEISNIVLSFNNIAPVGVPCALGAGTNILLGGGLGTPPAGWLGNTGQGCSLQYIGTSNILFTRNININAAGGFAALDWALDNAGTNTTVTWSNTITWNTGTNTTTSLQPRFLYFNSYASSTNVVYSYIPDAGILYNNSIPIGITVGLGNPWGTVVNNGGLVQLLNPTNTFAGGVQIAYARTLQALTLANVGQPSSIGTGANGYLTTVNGSAVQISGINLGSFDSSRGGTLSYIGTSNASCNQGVTIFGPTFSTATLEVCAVRNDSPNNSSLHLSNPNPWILQPQGASGGTNGYEVVLGGIAATTNTLDAIIGDMTNISLAVTPNSGNLLVNGSAWRLTAAQTYSATTTVTSATLLVDGSIASGLGVTINAGGVLSGTGTINENVNVLTNGLLTAGDGAIGTLTINGNVTNSGTIFMKLNAATGSNDVLALGANTLAYGGTLAVSNTAGTLSAGHSFTLFTAGTISGTFASISPATPGPGLAWDTSSLGSGILKVMTGSTPTSQPTITSITYSGTGTTLSGTNGTFNGSYHVVSSANVTTPLHLWTPVTNGSFDVHGAFNITIPASGPQEFYAIKQP